MRRVRQIRVRQMISNSGNPVANQFIIYTDEGRYFQSYNSLIAFIPNSFNKPIQVGPDWNYSRTTGKYRNQFLNMDKKELEAKLENGEAVFADLV